MKTEKWYCVPDIIYDTVALNDMEKQPTYQELLAAYNKLLMENKLLHKEIDRLQSLLNNKGVLSTPSTIKRHLSLEEKVNVFRNLFKGREDVFARRWYSRTSGKSGYQPVCRNEWDRLLCNKKKINAQNAPTGRSNRWNTRIYTGILRGKARTVRT